MRKGGLAFGGVAACMAIGHLLRSSAASPQTPASSAHLTSPKPQKSPTSTKPRIESVMVPGMKIIATTSAGTMTITAVDELVRSYTWEAATRSVEMWPRSERWYGSLGLYYPGDGDHWQMHNGITRGVLQEGQQHFKTVPEALQWIRSQNWQPSVYHDDGLMVAWSKTLERRQLNVDVWQIYINGRKPRHLLGSQNQRIVVAYIKSKSAADFLVDAVKNNDLGATHTLLAKGVSPNLRDGAGTPILVVAANRGFTAIVQALLNKGANPNARDQSSSTALIEAAIYSHEPIVKLLLAKGANIDDAFDKGFYQGATALIMAAMNSDTKVLTTLIEAGANVNAQQADGSSAIKNAASEGNTATVEILLQKGADVNAQDWLGITPLMAATIGGHVATVKSLIAHGADVNAKDDNTRRAYGQAQFNGDEKTIKALEASGQLNVRHQNGASVLYWAKLAGNKAIIQMLQQAGAK